MPEQIITGLIGMLGGGTVVAIIAAIRFRKKDNADAVKITAEATGILIDNFNKLIQTLQEEKRSYQAEARLYQEQNKVYYDQNRALSLTIDDLKMQVLKLQDMVNKLTNARPDVDVK